MSSNHPAFENHQHNQDHIPSPEFAGNYTFGGHHLGATGNLHHNPHHIAYDGIHTGHQAVGMQDHLFESPNSNLHALTHGVHLGAQGHLEATAGVLSGEVEGRPQYTSVIVEPTQQYQMAHEYVH